MRRTAIVVFARAPEREHKHLGLGQRAERRLHAHLLRRSLQMLGDVDADVVLAEEGPADLAVGSRVHRMEQRGDRFGARLLDTLRRVRDRGYDRLVVIGTDTPGLTADDVACAALSNDVVIGPSVDGGFYLLGLPASEIERLARLPWKTGGVAAALRRQFADLPRRELSLRRDLDDACDAYHLLPWLAVDYRLANGAPLSNAAWPTPAPVERERSPVDTPAARSASPRGPPSSARF